MNRRDILAMSLASSAFFSIARAAERARPRIGLIGSGNVGGNLGRVWAAAGYQVMFSSRDLEGDRRLAADAGANASAGTPQEAAAFGDVLVFAVPYGALPELGQSLGSALRNKIVIDACNPFPQRDGEIANEARAGCGSGVGAAVAWRAHRARLQCRGRRAHGRCPPDAGAGRHADGR